MRILHLDSGRELRGGQFQVRLLIQELEKRGHECTLLARGVLRDRSGATTLTYANLLRHAYQADIIHAHDARSHQLALALPRRPPLVVARRVAFPVGPSLFSRWKYRQPSHFIAISQHVARQLEAARVPAAKITVVPDGIVVPPARPRFPTETAWPQASIQVVTPFSADPLKRLDLAQAACKEAGVQFQASRDLEPDLKAATLFLYLSESEGLGSAILLATVHGVPVIASNTGGIPEIIRHQETGLLVPNQALAIAAAIRELLRSPTLAYRLASGAYRQTAQLFSSAKMALDTERVYLRLLSPRQP